MGRVKVSKTIKFDYVIDDNGFSGTEVAKRVLDDPVGSAIDAYLEREEEDTFEVTSQSITVELETHLTNDDIEFDGECVVLDCGHYEYRSGYCVVDSCLNWIGLSTHGPYLGGRAV